MLMSAVNVPSGIALGVTLMPPNPPSPFRNMKVERYVPGGGSSLVGDVAEEHAPMSMVQRMRGTAKRIDPPWTSTERTTPVRGLFDIDVPSYLWKRKAAAETSKGPKKAW